MDKGKKTILIVGGIVVVGIVLLLFTRKSKTASPTSSGSPVDTSNQLTDYQSLLALNNAGTDQMQQVSDQIGQMSAWQAQQSTALQQANQELANIGAPNTSSAGTTGALHCMNIHIDPTTGQAVRSC